MQNCQYNFATKCFELITLFVSFSEKIKIKSKQNKIENEMASASKVQKFDLEGLEEIKKSLICYYCKRPPRPKDKIFSHNSKKGCHPEIVTGYCCDHKKCENGFKQRFDSNLTKFASMIKFWNCKWHKFGCMKEFETEKLEAHEEICLLRELDCPKVGCEDTFPFRGILDHYQEKHSNVKIKDEVLEFKGTIEDLKKSTFILNSYGKPFFPQFHVEDDDDDDDFDIRNASLYIWVFGHGDRAEIDLFEMSIKFFVNGKPKISLTCPVKSIDYDDEYDLCNGHGSMHFRGSTLFQYYDVQSNETQHQDFIEFQLKIVSEKLDEVKKDENVESGVEDSEKEEK